MVCIEIVSLTMEYKVLYKKYRQWIFRRLNICLFFVVASIPLLKCLCLVSSANRPKVFMSLFGD